MNYITQYVNPAKLFLQNIGFYPMLYDQYIQLGKKQEGNTAFMKDITETTDFEYIFMLD
jgi:hypothetical protein